MVSIMIVMMGTIFDEAFGWQGDRHAGIKRGLGPVVR
jgi:hypothetical protein